MRVVALLYHDVVGLEGYGSSGFPDGDANIYKLTRAAFGVHLAWVSAVASPRATMPALLTTPTAGEQERPIPVIFTFDDGGVGGIEHAAPLLEEHGWRGLFFITTDWIGRPGFLDEPQLRELSARGHVIGSHSCSHPARMSACTDGLLRREWRDSCARLAEVLGAPVTTASVPGGYFSERVADAAREAGIRILFTSEPRRTVQYRGDLALVGRLSIMQGDPPVLARELAAGALTPVLRQAAVWEIKKVIKRIGGEHWLAFRRHVFRAR